MSIEPINDSMNNARIQGNINNPYRITNPDVGRPASNISPAKPLGDERVNASRSPYRNVTQTISRTMGQLSTEQRNYILEQYVRTDTALDKLGYYR